MKKFVALVCMITCIFGLTACGDEESLTKQEADKVSAAEEIAADVIVPLIEGYANDEELDLSQYSAEEIAYFVESSSGVVTDGYAFRNAVTSFQSGLEDVGEIVSVGDAEAVIDDKQIIVTVQIQGSEKDAEAEVIFSNDIFLDLESAALNPISGMGELVKNAALNTLIGMGTVFIVLILISAIISCLKIVPKLQEKWTKKETQDALAAGNGNSQAPAAESYEAEDLSGDQELVAVIAAAIAAYEGSASADGFVVRSIHKVNRARR